MSCPNPSAHPVGVRHQGDRPLVLNGRKRSSAAITAVLLAIVPSASCPQLAGAGRARHRRRPDPRRQALPPGRAGPGAATTTPRWSSTSSASDLGSLQADQDRQDDRLDHGPRAGPGLHRQPVRGHRASPPSARSSSPTTRARSSPSCRRCRPTTTSRRSSSPTTPPSSRRSTSAARPPTTARGRDRRRLEKQLADEKADDRRQARRGQGPARRAQGRGARARCSPPAAVTSGSRPTCRPPGGPRSPSVRALAQVGDAYVYGAAGPSAFDCSGLTMMAWAQAGVGLPHSSSAQFGVRPAHRLQRPAAGRPGLLLQPDQPRRHVHRQRPDRARRQPRGRRPGGRPVLDAVLRRGPPWLIPARTPM